MEPMATSRPKTFRVENIPPDTTAEKLIKYFYTEDQPRVQVRSIVPAVDSYKLDMQEYTATITFQSVDPNVSSPRLVDDDLSIDCDFHGFTPLNHPQEPIAADIIAVSGLAAHAFGSWAHSTKNMWLRDYLPRDVSNARVLIYGYPLQLHGNMSRSILSDHSPNMIHRLLTMRESAKCQDRPIVFIGHSLGCLIIKKVLCDINGSVGIYSSRLPVRSIIFLGAPHRGLETTALESLVKSKATEDMIRELKAESPTLTELNDKFRHVAKAIDILTCYELSPTKTAIEVLYDRANLAVVANGLQMPDGTWRREGPPIMMVSLDSARQWYPREDCVACQADHTQIAKLKRGENGIYPSVSWAIKKALLSAGDLYSEAKGTPRDESFHSGSLDEASTMRRPKAANRRNSMALSSHPVDPALILSTPPSEDVIGQQIERLHQAELNNITHTEDSWPKTDLFSGIDSSKDTREKNDDRSSAGPSEFVETDITSVLHDEDGIAAEKSKLGTSLNTKAVALRLPTKEANSDSPNIQGKLDELNTVQTKKYDITIDGIKSTTMDEVMISAIVQGKAERTQKLLEHRYDIECKDEYGRTPLLLATVHGHEALVRMLLEQGAKLTARKRRGITILHILASNSEKALSETLVDLVLGYRPPLDASDESGTTPLMRACCSGKLLLVTKFIHHGADVRAVDRYGYTPLHYLAYYKQAKATPLVVANSALIDATSIKPGKIGTPLHEAAGTSTGISSICKQLLLAGADKEARTRGTLMHPDSTGIYNKNWTPLLYAVLRSNEACVACLLEYGVDINASDGSGRTSLHIGAFNGHLEIVKAFLDHGANSTIRQSRGGLLGHRASAVSMNPDVDINASDSSGRTSLHFGASNGHLEIVKALLDHGANPTIRHYGGLLGQRASAVSMNPDVSSTQKTAIRTLLKGAEKAWKQSHRK